MKTLVIHPKDNTTDFLSNIYNDKDWTVITTNVSHKHLKEQLISHDRIVMLGHGTKYGLIGFDRLIINSKLVYILREKHCVCIWCNADEFVKKYNLKGFYTGMIISEYDEAVTYSISTDIDALDKSNDSLSYAIKESIDEKDMLLIAKRLYEDVDAVTEFNRSKLYFR